MIDTPTTLYLGHDYFRSVLDEDVLLDADVKIFMLLDFLFEDQVLLDLVQEHLALANIATIESLLFQRDTVDHLAHFLRDMRR